MVRTIVAIIGGPLVWMLVATLLNFGLRAAIPGLHAAEPNFAFTLPMMIGRLAIGVAASLAAGAAVSLIAPASRFAPWIVAALALAVFIPEHIHIGARLPLWYHLVFLLTLGPLILLGARMAKRR